MLQTMMKTSAVHTRALARFDDIQSAVRPERLQSLEDRRFYSIAGAQWEGSLGDQFENKPRIEVNKIHLAIIRIFNEYRNNRIDVQFVSKDGSKNNNLSDVCMGLYRADVQDSCAEEADDNCFEEGVGGGMGAWRLRAVYENEDDPKDERQRIRFEPIYDADSCVFFDLDSKRQDKADAKYCFVLNSMTTQAYIDEYEDDPATWPKGIESTVFDWSTPDVVYVAEYYEVEHVKDEIVTFRDVLGMEKKFYQSDLDEDPSMLDEMNQMMGKEVSRRAVKTKKVHKYILSGGGVLEDSGIIAGCCIPIVPFYAKRWFVDGVERCMGHVRLAKDAQRLKNMQLSKLAEISALSSVEKPILTPQQISGHQLMWADDNIKNYPYLLINPITDAAGNELPSGPVAYTHSAQVPPAMAALLQITEQDMKEILGNVGEAEKVVSNISGKAVELIQTRLDMQSFIYISNFAKAKRRSGEIWLSMAKDIYAGGEEKRKMKVLGPQGEVSSTELMKPVMSPEGEITYENDLSDASLDVSVEVGPTSQSKKDSIVRSLTGMMALTQDPETLQVLQSMTMMNMEGEGISDVRDYYRAKLVKMGVLKPTEDEKKMLKAAAANEQPDPQTLLMQSMAQNELAKAEKAKADTMKTLAETEKTKADTEKILGDMSIGAQKNLLDTAERIGLVSGNRGPASASPRTKGQSNG
jgi:hypothetical protein